ncbi:MAG: Lrp/AsnC family transcriptional regulator [Holosporales bacterium]|jgi:DNA-binding Lrp family transcriptional regulator|nr:Lrp/AsnC family transcriptional regulator [Holosporales bacterium]
MARLDTIDRMILATIQKNGRMTNIELSERVGISAPPCLRRLKCLEEANIIAGYRAEINREMLGYKILAICLVSITSQSLKWVKHFVGIVENSKNIRSCFSTVGGECFILTIVAKDLDEYNRVIKDEIQACSIVASVKSFILANEYKNEVGIPIDCS